MIFASSTGIGNGFSRPVSGVLVQTPEKTEVHTPTADPNAAVSVPETPADSVVLDEPAESVPEETPASSEQPAEAPAETPAETPAGSEPSASTEVPAEEPPAESSSSSEAPSISLPTQDIFIRRI